MSPETVELRRLIQTEMKKVQMAALGGDMNGNVCEEVFMQKTGLDTKDKLYKFRKNNPELVKQHGDKFIYNLPGYFKLFQ